MVLSKDDLINTTGGGTANKLGLGALLTAIGTIIIGFIDGFLRPLKCNS